MSESKLFENDLSDEEWREYDTGGRVYRINNPKRLYIRDGGTSHRVLDSEGVVHLVSFGPKGNRDCVLRWKPRAGANPVAF